VYLASANNLQFTLKGKTAVITGAARGLGLTFATALASANCNLAVLDILHEPSPCLLALRDHHGIKLEYYRTDITSRPEVTAAIENIEAEFGRIDININAAGVVSDESFLKTTDENIERTFAVNFTGSFLVAQACANSMVARYKSIHGGEPAAQPTTGTIIFIASIATYIASSAQQISCYTASKAAVKGLVKPMAMELAPYGIRVNSLSPGYMMTDMMRGLQEKQPQLVDQFEKETLFGRIGMPVELKGAILYLCCESASGWYTGQDLLVDGGASTWKHPAMLASGLEA
jgi:NAD(P)-dependent dehydrogenase (short-subunit alcohol dehydrogenase family)